MTAYYKPGMTEAEQRALSATLSPEVRADLLAKGLAALPKCWTEELQSCANLTAVSSKWDCQAIADGWTGDFDKMEAAFNALPKCQPATSTASNVEKAAGVGLAILLLGLAIKGFTRR